MLLFYYFLPASADPFFSNFTDILISCLICVRFWIGFLGKLYHYKFSISPILSIEFHNGMSGSSRTREEIKDNPSFGLIST